MTHLRKMMLEELQRRNYSEHTTRYYIRTVEDFARYFRCSPDRLGPRHIREYQTVLFQKRKLSPGSPQADAIERAFGKLAHCEEVVTDGGQHVLRAPIRQTRASAEE